MKAYVTGSSALHFWRRTPRSKALLAKHVADPLSDCPTSPDVLSDIKLESLDLGSAPIRLMVPAEELRVSRRKYKYSVQRHTLPESAFCQIESHTCVASPELCLLEASRYYSKQRLMELCMEMCGKYAIVPETQRGYISRDHQLATTQSIRAFLKCLPPYIHGAKKLNCVIEHIQDGSRSPMETREYLLMCLPKRLGGYGLPRAKLNLHVDLTPEERRMTKRRHLECDMCWPDKQVIVEYDGHDDHESRDDRAHDAAKRNVLISRGYDVFTITGKQICNKRTFHELICDISQCLDFRLRAFPENWREKHLLLRQEIFASMSGFEEERFSQPQP